MKNTEKVVGNAKFILGIQHVLAMFGATVLVPFLTGLNPSIALISAGVGTLIFHLCTKRIVPVFLGSSFAFIGALTLVLKNEGIGAIKGGVCGEVVDIKKGGVIAAGLIYVIMSFLVKTFGVEKIKSFFPPIVTGPIIMLIGLRMSPTALNMAGYANGKFDTKSLIVAFSVILTMVSITMMKKSFLRLIPILAAVIVGYIVATILGMVDFSVVSQAKWIGLSTEAASDLFTMPSMSLTGIIAIAPIALVVFIEHIGDITTNGAVVGKDFFKDPGIHRTLLGDGLATIAAGFLGGPANTTYGENTGVLAVTGVYDPAILRIAACYAIILGFIGKFGILLQTIPLPVMGGVSVILFGMIASVGVRTVVDAQLDFGNSRNLIISSIIFVLGIAVDNISIWQTVSVSGLALAAFSGVVLNKILPKDREIKLKKLD